MGGKEDHGLAAAHRFFDRGKIILLRPFAVAKVPKRRETGKAVLFQDVHDLDNPGHIKRGIAKEDIPHRGRFVDALANAMGFVFELVDPGDPFFVNEVAVHEIMKRPD